MELTIYVEVRGLKSNLQFRLGLFVYIVAFTMYSNLYYVKKVRDLGSYISHNYIADREQYTIQLLIWFFPSSSFWIQGFIIMLQERD